MIQSGSQRRANLPPLQRPSNPPNPPAWTLLSSQGVSPPWLGQKQKKIKKWAAKPAQTVNSAEYKELKQYIHMPYRKVDNVGVKCYYFPTYPVFKIKNITEFDFQSLSAKINGVLILKIFIGYKDRFSPQLILDDTQCVNAALFDLFQIKQKGKQNVQQNQQELNISLKKYLYVQLNRDDPLRLPSKRIFQGQIKQEYEKGQVRWTIRKEFKIALSAGTFWQDLIAPFNLLNFKLSLTFEDIDIALKKSPNASQLVKFKFNCMKRVGNNTAQQRKHIFEQLRFTDDGTLGEYDLAETGLDVHCQKYLSKQLDFDISNQYRSYKVITFTIPFYKYPIMDSLTIFIPLVLITILTLFTFVQGPDFNDKIGNIATLMIVYVGLMPVISQSLPPTTSITLIDIVVYCQLTISVLCLIRGFIIKEYTADQFNDYLVWQDPVFRMSVAIAVATGIILAFLLVYYCINKSYYYNMQEADLDQIDQKLYNWVSPHMHNIARNIKTGIQKMQIEKDKQPEKGRQSQQVIKVFEKKETLQQLNI